MQKVEPKNQGVQCSACALPPEAGPSTRVTHAGLMQSSLVYTIFPLVAHLPFTAHESLGAVPPQAGRRHSGQALGQGGGRRKAKGKAGGIWNWELGIRRKDIRFTDGEYNLHR